MLVFGIETSLQNCALAIWRDGEMLYSVSQNSKSSQAEILPQLAQDCFDEIGIKPNEIEKIIVTIGPGSFSGVRIGLAFAKGLAMAINCPIIGISSLEVLAAQAASEKTIAIIEQMGSIFAAAFDGRKITMPPTRFEDYDFLEPFDDQWVISLVQSPKFESHHNFIINEAINPFILAGLGALRNEKEYPPIPQYLRGADAKIWQGSQYV